MNILFTRKTDIGMPWRLPVAVQVHFFLLSYRLPGSPTHQARDNGGKSNVNERLIGITSQLCSALLIWIWFAISSVPQMIEGNCQNSDSQLPNTE
jgi:hypothetical protein